jgi:Ser/Thr protein kinase RdoA (MazF antagonist)
MKDFASLTHIGKGRRLRPLLMRTLRAYGIENARLRQFRETINIVYRVVAPDGGRYLLRLTPPWHFHGLEDVRSEIAWMRALCRESTVDLPTPIAALDGESVVTEAWPQIPGEWHCVLFSWIPGRMLASRWTQSHIERYGRLSALLHLHGESFRPPPGFRIRPFDGVFPHCAPGFANPEPLVLFDRLDPSRMPHARRRLFQRIHDRAQSEIDRLLADGLPQPIHNDLHPWNVMISGERLFAIDFENCLLGFPVQDLGTTLHYIEQHFSKVIPFDACVAAYRRGYETVRPWPARTPGQLAAMTAAHRLLLCNFYAASQDPEYREFAAGFIARMEAHFRRFPWDA